MVTPIFGNSQTSFEICECLGVVRGVWPEAFTLRGYGVEDKRSSGPCEEG